MVDYLYDFDAETVQPQPGVLLADHYLMPTGFSGHRSSGSKDWLLIYTLSGSGDFRVHKKVQRCEAGDVAILPPGVPHHYATPKDCIWELMWVHFLPLPEWHVWLQLPRTEENLIYFPVEEYNTRIRIKNAFERLIHDTGLSTKSDQQLALIALSEVLVLLHRQYEKQSGEIIDERIERVIQHLAEHLKEHQSLPQLAEVAGLSVSRLCHLFQLQTGGTVIEKLNQMRLEKSSRMLEFTTQKIQEIAHEVGFESPFYFTKKFTQRFGKSPSEFRRLVQRK
jgi:AraC family transcriptional regulator of arabinose operon